MRRSIVVACALLWATGCGRNTIPEPGSPHYRDLVSAFYVGVAALQAGEDVRAKQGLSLASKIAPGEPAAWANLGLLELRQQQYDAAYKDVDTAHTLAPENSHVESLLGLIESKRGNLAAAIAHWEQAVKLDPNNLKAIYALEQETERLNTAQSDGEARKLIDSILQREPNNAAALVEAVRLAAKAGDQSRMMSLLAQLRAVSQGWNEAAKRQLDGLQQANQTNVRGAAVQVMFLRNLLVRDAAFRQSQDALRPSAGTVGEPFLRFVKTASPSSLPAPADRTLRFTRENAGTPDSQDVTWAGTLVIDAKADARVIWADSKGLHTDSGATLPIPGNARLGRHGIAAGDINYDFKTDIVMATSGGLRIYQQGLTPLFSDVTAKTKLPSEVVNGSYTGVWLFDVDLDGDLDVVLGSSTGDPILLRNNGDGTYGVLRPFSGVDGVRDFAAADIDSDGDPDVAFVDGAGRLHVFNNERLGNYRPRPIATSPPGLAAMAVGDVNGDGVLDFVALGTDGAIWRIGDREQVEIARVEPSAAGSLLLADLDNNGSLDLIVGGRVLLNDANGFTALTETLPGDCAGLLDMDGDGRLDAVVVTGGRLSELRNQGRKNYGWQTLRTRAAQTTGDQRINAFGYGGEVELRSGLLTQKQPITAPVMHFGLGENPSASLARIVWPNGALQVEFDLKPDTAVLAVQRLKGSCPFLFAWDGTRMRFVKDCAPWSPALGLHVNAQKVAGIGQTEEWFKIPGQAVQARDGFYDLRVTAEYWETFYIDGYSFLAVDHPKGTEVFSDERFAVPAPPLRLYATSEVNPFAAATDDLGHDVSGTVVSVDSKYLDDFGRGQYQGVTRDHWVELSLPADAPRTGPLYLIGSGWLHPTDATVNVAMGQGGAPVPHGLSLEVQQPDGTWQVARRDLGFPAGRLKTVVLDLSGLFRPAGERRLRLRTNLEIYWDRLGWAAGTTQDRWRVQQLRLADATLEYRGFSKMLQADASSPELPEYDAVEQRGPRWRDLEGYYTRYGNVRPLLEKTDDRLLITNAGDELRMRVAAPPAPPAGWVRDLMMVGNGWIKDGDYNCTFSRTVLPLPYHGLRDYDRAPSALEDDPAYQNHPEDWREFHTRYVSPDLFARALWQ